MLSSKQHGQKRALTARICYGFVSDTRTLTSTGCIRSLNRVTATTTRNFYQDNHICATTCASSTLSSRVGGSHLRRAAKGTHRWILSGIQGVQIQAPDVQPQQEPGRCHLMQTWDDAEQVIRSTEPARNQHLLAPVKFLLAGTNYKNKNAARQTSPKQLLTTEVGSMIFFDIPDQDGNTFKCDTDLRECGLLCCAPVTSGGGLFTLSWEASAWLAGMF